MKKKGKKVKHTSKRKSTSHSLKWLGSSLRNMSPENRKTLERKASAAALDGRKDFLVTVEGGGIETDRRKH
jgi:hypothetical protein